MTRRIAGAAALGAALLAGGCAVMTVDVNVYKGPLANDEIVQLQQFQSMAPGMRNVLVRLEMQLMAPGPHQNTERASAVTEVLSLFDDQPYKQLEPLQPFRNQLRGLRANYDQLLEVLLPRLND